MDMPLAKKKRVTDVPIYIYFAFYEDPKVQRVQNRLFVIEERDGAAGETSAGELGEEVLKTEKERVRVFNLPDLVDLIRHSSVAFAKSRLFIVGGSYCSERGDEEVNGVHYLDLQHKDPSCETSAISDCPEDFSFVCGAAVSDDGDWIYGLGWEGNMFRFHANHIERRTSEIIPDVSSRVLQSSPVLISLTETKMFLFLPTFYEITGVLGYCDFKSRSWHSIDSETTWCRRSPSAVVVGDKYLITFAVWRPMTDDYCPALYVYDIESRKWLPEPVQGLLNDGTVLPSIETHCSPLYYSTVMQIRRDELKFALVWSIDVTDYHNDFHWSNFILSIQENEDQDVPPTFRAECFSSESFSAAGLALLVNITTAG